MRDLDPVSIRGVREGLADVGVASEFASHEGLQVLPWRRRAQETPKLRGRRASAEDAEEDIKD